MPLQFPGEVLGDIEAKRIVEDRGIVISLFQQNALETKHIG